MWERGDLEEEVKVRRNGNVKKMLRDITLLVYSLAESKLQA